MLVFIYKGIIIYIYIGNVIVLIFILMIIIFLVFIKCVNCYFYDKWRIIK